MTIDGQGIPLARVLAGAHWHDSPLLAATLDRLAPLPDQVTVHLTPCGGVDGGPLDAGYDCAATARAISIGRAVLARLSETLIDEQAHHAAEIALLRISILMAKATRLTRLTRPARPARPPRGRP